MSGIQRLPIADIHIPPNRIREINEAWVEMFIASLADGHELPPIKVRGNGDKFTLVAGLHRLTAHQRREVDAIDVHVVNYETDDKARLDEILENVLRNPLTALERAQSLFEMQQIYQWLYPEMKPGGDRRSEKVKNQTAILAVWSEILEKVGLSERAFRRAVAIWKGLDPAIRDRVRGTWLADHQAGLGLLAEQDEEMQAKVCDILFADAPKASSVADALILAANKKLPAPADKLLNSTLGNIGRLDKTRRAAVYDAFEREIREHAKTRGWF